MNQWTVRPPRTAQDEHEEEGHAAVGRATESVEAVRRQSRLRQHCSNRRVVRNGVADWLQRYKCQICAKTVNPLAGMPLAGLRHQGWADGRRTAEHLNLALSTAFRWRHRLLGMPWRGKAISPTGQPGLTARPRQCWLQLSARRLVVKQPSFPTAPSHHLHETLGMSPKRLKPSDNGKTP